MDINEYEQVKEMSYLEYCDYLQKKYGKGLYDYMTKSYNKNPKCTRTKEGLFAHHKMEDHVIMLSTKEIAMSYPIEWQSKDNIVYCDYLEHILLHVLICKYPAKDAVGAVGVGGVVNFFVPELNDFYSGWVAKLAWKKNCLNRVANDKQVYLEILKQFIQVVNDDLMLTLYCGSADKLHTSCNAKYGEWDEDNNNKIYSEIAKLWTQY